MGQLRGLPELSTQLPAQPQTSKDQNMVRGWGHASNPVAA